MRDGDDDTTSNFKTGTKRYNVLIWGETTPSGMICVLLELRTGEITQNMTLLRRILNQELRKSQKTWLETIGTCVTFIPVEITCSLIFSHQFAPKVPRALYTLH